MSEEKKPVVVEVYHSQELFSYAKQKLYEHLKKLPEGERSVGVEMSPMLIGRLKRFAEFEMSTDQKFWRDLLVHAEEFLKARIIPLVDDKTTELITEAQKYANKIAKKTPASRAVLLSQQNKLLGLAPKEAKKLLEMWGKAFAHTDEQLHASLSTERPAISFVGAGHGEPLKATGKFEVAPYPEEMKDNAFREQLAYMKRAAEAHRRASKRK